MDLIHRSLSTDNSCFHFRNEAWQYLPSQGQAMLPPYEPLGCVWEVEHQVSPDLWVSFWAWACTFAISHAQSMTGNLGEPTCWGDCVSHTQRSSESDTQNEKMLHWCWASWTSLWRLALSLYCLLCRTSYLFLYSVTKHPKETREVKGAWSSLMDSEDLIPLSLGIVSWSRHHGIGSLW